MPDNFGDILGRGLHAEHHPVLLARALRQTEVAVTEVRSEQPTQERSDPLPPQDAFAVAVQLRDFPVHEWWEGGRQAPVTALGAGQTTVYDLRRDPRFRMNNPFHSIHFQLPRRLLDGLADESSARRIGDLEYSPGRGVDDPVLRHLALALRPAFAHPEQASHLFVDHVTLAVATHVAATYGRMSERRYHHSGGLSPWQHRRALALLDERLDGNLRIADLAKQCGLSGSYFTQAFKKSAGVTPHRWLMQRRIEKARELLRNPGMTPAEIALACGFANQSHFTRVFRAVVGCPPVEWRRRCYPRG